MNPCGHIVDAIRSCYTVPCRFYRDSPTNVGQITWYFQNDPKAKGLPFPSLFYSRIYDRHEWPQELVGELYGPAAWSGGLPPAEVGSGGLCGTSEQWAEGALLGDPLPLVYPGTLLPVCCGQIGHSQGGVAIGEVNVVSGCCTDPIPALLFITFGPLFGPCCPGLDNAVVPFPFTPGPGLLDPTGINMYTSPTFNVGGVDVFFNIECSGPGSSDYGFNLWAAGSPPTIIQPWGLVPGALGCSPFAQSCEFGFCPFATSVTCPACFFTVEITS